MIPYKLVSQPLTSRLQASPGHWQTDLVILNSPSTASRVSVSKISSVGDMKGDCPTNGLEPQM